MTLGKHTKTEEGTIRRERGDALMKNLAKEYPALKQFNPNMKLETLRNKLGANSLDQALKVLKKSR